MRTFAVIAVLLALAACGVDGEPQPPGIAVSGTVEAGMATDGG